MKNSFLGITDYMAFFARNISFQAKNRFYKYFNFVKKEKKISSFALYKDVFFSSFKYNLTPLEFFTLRFYDKTKAERSEFLTARTLRKFQSIMNPTEEKEILADKVKFLTHFKDFIGRKWATLPMLKKDNNLLSNLINAEAGKIVLKNAMGQAGKQIKVIDTQNLDVHNLMVMMEKEKLDLLEEYVIQHDEMMRIAPRGLNTVRILSQIYNGEVIIINVSLRLSVYGYVDNLMSGNIIMPVDIETGIVIDTAVYYDITKEEVKVHPLTGVGIVGFKIPRYQECIELIKKAALLTPETRSVGWDVGITNNGVILIEGNHNWGYACQYSQRKGTKESVFKYLRLDKENQ